MELNHAARTAHEQTGPLLAAKFVWKGDYLSEQDSLNARGKTQGEEKRK